MTIQTSHLLVRWIAGVSASGMISLALAQDPSAADAKPAAPEMSAEDIKTHSSYALGHRAGSDFARQFGRFGVMMNDIERETFMNGFADAFKGEDFSVSEENLQTAMEAFGKQVQEREVALAEVNKAKGQEFLAENAERKGVVTTDSGLQYEVVAKGGDQVYVAPKEGEGGQKVFKVNYKGTLIDGTEFDSSPEGEPVSMTLQVVPGFREALTTMPVGAKWRLFLAPDLAYGEQRAGAKIGPNSALIFEVELVGIEDAPAPQGLPFQLPGQ